MGNPDGEKYFKRLMMAIKFKGSRCQFCGHEWADVDEILMERAVLGFDKKPAHKSCWDKWVQEHGEVPPEEINNG